MAIQFQPRRTLGDSPSPSWLLTWESKRALKKALKKTAPQFPVLAQARVGDSEAPYTLLIEATIAVPSVKAREYLSALTLCLVPLTEEHSVELEARIYHGTTLLKRYEATGRQQFHLQLFTMFFGAKHRVPGRTIEQTFQDLFLQIQRDAPQLFPQATE